MTTHRGSRLRLRLRRPSRRLLARRSLGGGGCLGVSLWVNGARINTTKCPWRDLSNRVDRVLWMVPVLLMLCIGEASGESVLVQAVKQGHIDVVRALVTRGADVN